MCIDRKNVLLLVFALLNIQSQSRVKGHSERVFDMFSEYSGKTALMIFTFNFKFSI